MRNKILFFTLALLVLHSGRTLGNDTYSRSTAAVQQSKEKVVKGVVSDDMGPIAGATVMIKGTTKGMVTDMDGNFTMSVPVGSTIVVSFIGYQDKEIVYKGEAKLDIHLSEDVTTLDEVQIIAYGATKKVTYGAQNETYIED